MRSNIPVGILAGIVSALLATVLATGMAPAIILLYLAPFPILAVSLGWRHQTGLIATAAGGVALLPLDISASMMLVFGIGLPAWWVAYLLLLGRTTENGTEWYPLGRVLLAIVWIALSLLVALLLIIGSGSYEGYVEHIRAYVTAMEPQLKQILGSQYSQDDFTYTLVTQIPSGFTSSVTYIYVLNVWIAAKVIMAMKRLPRPWPFIPATRLPLVILAIGACGAGLSFLEGFPGLIGLAAFGAASAALLLQGLCVLHDVSRRWPQRGLLLGLVYVAILLQPLLAGTVLQYLNLVLVVLGTADVLFSIRNKLGGGNTSPSK